MSTDCLRDAGVLEGRWGEGREWRCSLRVVEEEAEERDERENWERRRDFLVEYWGDSHSMPGEIMPLSPGIEEVGEGSPEVGGKNGFWNVDAMGEVGPDFSGENVSLSTEELGDVDPETIVLTESCRIDVPGEITELLLRSISPHGRSHDEPCV
jgi:hypothetical protein